MTLSKGTRANVNLGVLILALLLSFPALCAAQGKIAFSSARDGNFEIYSMNADGTGQMRLTNDIGDDLYPSLSKDGTKITFYSNRTGSNEIYIMDADGGNLMQLTNTAGDNFVPTFSPDGSKIVFSSSRTGDLEIWVMDADGANQTNISNNPGADRDPSYSPDGTRIVFESYRNGFCGEIWVMNANGANPIKLTDSAGGTHCDRRPYYNPAGNKITFHADREFGIEVYIMDANGAGLTRLTDSPGSTQSTYSSFSPDGSKIVFTSDRVDDSEVYVMNPDGTGQTRITTSPGADLMPTWSIDPNTAPTILATDRSVARDTSGSFSIASVNDNEDDETSLAVTVNGGAGATSNGVTVSGLAVSSAGAVTANIAATCSASNASFTLRVTDSGGLFNEATLNVTVTNETEAPVLTLPADIVTSLPMNSTDLSVVVNFMVSAVDNCDASPTVVATPPSGSAFPVGTTTVNVTATDASGNTANGSFTVTVLYNFAGFFQPVENLPAFNIVSAGQSIPIKFSLSGDKRLDIFAAGFPTSQMIPCTGETAPSPIVETTTPGASSLTYDPLTDTYQYVWQTERSWRGTCRQLTVMLNDGSTHVAWFRFR